MKNLKLKSFVLGVSFLCCFPRFVRADSFSLFHKPDELKEVHQNRHHQKVFDNHEAIHLSGLLYQDKKQWRLWINGKPFRSKSWPALTVLDVTPGAVSFKYFHEGESLFFDPGPQSVLLFAGL